MKFKFVGKLCYGDTPIVDSVSKNGADYSKLNVSVAATESNRGFTELFGMKPNKDIDIKIGNNEVVTVPLDDRFNDSITEKVPGYRKTFVNIEKFNDYVYAFDAIDEIREHIDELKGNNVTISGNVTRDFYEGKIRNKFQIHSFYKADENIKCGLTVDSVVYFSYDDIDTSEYKDKKVIYLNGYTKESIKELDNESRFVPQTFVIDHSKVDFNNPKHILLVGAQLDAINFEYANGSLKFTGDKKKVYSTGVNCIYKNGAEEIPFDETMLTDKQKRQIEAGLHTIDDYKPKGNIYGERKEEYKIYSMMVGDTYKDGPVVEGFKKSEFEDLIYTGGSNVSVNEGFLNTPESADSDAMDLFG